MSVIIPGEILALQNYQSKFSFFPKTTILMEAKHILRAVFDVKALQRELD